MSHLFELLLYITLEGSDFHCFPETDHKREEDCNTKFYYQLIKVFD
jgi:hypothetical protein